MKKKLRSAVLVLAAVLVLSSCGIKEEAEPETSGSGTKAVLETEEEAEGEGLSALFEVTEESSVLYEFTGELLEDLGYPEMTLAGEDILIWDISYSEGEDGSVLLILFDPSGAEILAENELSDLSGSAPQVTEAGIFLCDSGNGTVCRLNEDLEIEEEWEFEADYSSWYVSSSGESLYKVTEDNELTETSLESGETEILYSAPAGMYTTVSNSTGADLSCVEGEMFLSEEYWVDFSDGSLNSSPFLGALSWVSCCGGNWLGYAYNASDTRLYYLGEDEDYLAAELEEGNLFQTEGGGYIVYTPSDGNELFLYGPSGEFVSSCVLPGGEDLYSSSSCYYSEEYGGCFLIAYENSKNSLLFWDLKEEVEGEDLNTVSISEYEEDKGGEAVSSALYERAEELEEAYGVEICIADQCETEFEDFNAEQYLDEEGISSGLDLLEETLSSYPEDFFEQLQFDHIRKIQFNLTGSITASNSDWGEGDYNGFSQEDGDTYIIAVDLNETEGGTLFHEISHVIDDKLEWDSSCRDGALYSEETWESLNPEGFEYSYSYDGWWDLEFEGDEWEYFIDTYSMINPTEDRARIMEYAMNGESEMITEYEPISEKLSYYSQCIRDAFDDSSWPETTVWEEPLS